jgi:hypothetical protein
MVRTSLFSNLRMPRLSGLDVLDHMRFAPGSGVNPHHCSDGLLARHGYEQDAREGGANGVSHQALQSKKLYSLIAKITGVDTDDAADALRDGLNRWGVILAGGIGSRFWPLSTTSRPKQLLPLIDDKPLLVNTLSRLEPIIPPERILSHDSSTADAVAAAAPRVPSGNIIAEPRPVGTAGALAWAAREIERRDGSDAVMISVHSDWAIGDENAYRDTLIAASEWRRMEGACHRWHRADPAGSRVRIHPSGRQDRERRDVGPPFCREATRERAEWMLHEGYLWNSGISSGALEIFSPRFAR